MARDASAATQTAPTAATGTQPAARRRPLPPASRSTRHGRIRQHPAPRDGAPPAADADPHAPPVPARPRAWSRSSLLGAWLGLLIVGSVTRPGRPDGHHDDAAPVPHRRHEDQRLPAGRPRTAQPLRARSASTSTSTSSTRSAPRPSSTTPNGSRASRTRSPRTSARHRRPRAALRRRRRRPAPRALGLAVYRRPRRALAAGGLALALLAASGATAFATWNPKSVLEPKFSGLLASAPSVVGNARSIVTEFDVYQQELARLVTNVTKLYDATSTLPAYQPDPSTTRVLHVSDIHLNPAAWQIIASLVEQYEIDVIIDTGDTMDHGTRRRERLPRPGRRPRRPLRLGARQPRLRRPRRRYLETAGQQRPRPRRGRAGQRRRAARSRAGATRSSPRTAPSGPEGDPAGARGGPAAGRGPARPEVARAPRSTSPSPTTRVLAKRDRRPRSRSPWPGTPTSAATSPDARHPADDRGLDGRRRTARGGEGGPAEGRRVRALPGPGRRRLQAWDEITLGGLGLTTAEVTRHLAGGEQAGLLPLAVAVAVPSSPSPSPAPDTLAVSARPANSP